jgi:hypothetical protein
VQAEEPEKEAKGAVAVANAIKDMRALSVLSLKSNNLQAAGGKALAEGLKGNQVITELDISSNNLGVNSIYNADTSGIIALADVIPDMGAMTSLNISKNSIGAEGAKHIAEGIKVSKWMVAVVLASFSCPSDHWSNCCCLLLSTGQPGATDITGGHLPTANPSHKNQERPNASKSAASGCRYDYHCCSHRTKYELVCPQFVWEQHRASWIGVHNNSSQLQNPLRKHAGPSTPRQPRNRPSLSSPQELFP